jgi:hypothetical protein
MADSFRVIIARLDENVTHVKNALPPLIQQSQAHTLDIALIKRDGWWRSTIFFSISGLIGALTTLAVEWIRHS